MWDALTEEASLRLGYGVVQWSMDFKRASDGATARIVQRDNQSILLSYGSRPSFLRESNFGYTFVLNYVDFNMTKQAIPGDPFADVGTSVSGHLVYAVPSLFYQWGEHREAGRFVRLGFGVGLGMATFNGTAQLSTGEVFQAQKSTYDPRLTVNNFLEARWSHVALSLSYASPRVYGDGYDIRVSGVSAYLAYLYYF